MVDILEALYTRRSVRKYTDQQISDEYLHEILKSAMLTPSACNDQPWQFVVLRSPEMLEKISKTSPYTGMAAKAPLVIAVCGDLSKETRCKGYWVQDCSAAIENMMLAARGRGVGSVWCGVHPQQDREKFVQELLGLPDSIKPLGLVIFGYPADGDKAFHEEDRYKEDRVHMEKW